MTLRRSIIALATLAAVGTLVAGPSRAAPPFRVIVNAASPVQSLDRKFLTEAFLKKATRWPAGDLIRPVDQPAESPTRRRFSEDVLNRSVAAVKNYWQQLIFSGRAIPPPELDSDEDVIRYVARFPGAIGYVSGTGDLTSVKTVIVK